MGLQSGSTAELQSEHDLHDNGAILLRKTWWLDGVGYLAVIHLEYHVVARFM